MFDLCRRDAFPPISTLWPTLEFCRFSRARRAELSAEARRSADHAPAKNARRETAGTERSMVGTSRLIRGVIVQFADEKIDFGSLEAGDRDIKI